MWAWPGGHLACLNYWFHLASDEWVQACQHMYTACMQLLWDYTKPIGHLVSCPTATTVGELRHLHPFHVPFNVLQATLLVPGPTQTLGIPGQTLFASLARTQASYNWFHLMHMTWWPYCLSQACGQWWLVLTTLPLGWVSAPKHQYMTAFMAV